MSVVETPQATYQGRRLIEALITSQRLPAVLFCWLGGGPGEALGVGLAVRANDVRVVSNDTATGTLRALIVLKATCKDLATRRRGERREGEEREREGYKVGGLQLGCGSFTPTKGQRQGGGGRACLAPTGCPRMCAFTYVCMCG